MSSTSVEKAPKPSPETKEAEDTVPPEPKPGSRLDVKKVKESVYLVYVNHIASL